MRVIIGTYRGQKYLPDCLRSLDRHVSGATDIVFIDDSGDWRNAVWEQQYGRVVRLRQRGYAPAMAAACKSAQGQMCFWLEEDFTFLCDIDLQELGDMLAARPHLAQICLLRGPWSPQEHQAGGIIEMFRALGEPVIERDGLLEQTYCFSANPSVWRGEVFASGWPQVPSSEDAKRDQLLAAGYRFAYLPGIRVEHRGTRAGFGY